MISADRKKELQDQIKDYKQKIYYIGEIKKKVNTYQTDISYEHSRMNEVDVTGNGCWVGKKADSAYGIWLSIVSNLKGYYDNVDALLDIMEELIVVFKNEIAANNVDLGITTIKTASS